MSAISQKKAGAILQYVQMALSICISLVYTPIMLNILGQSEYGLYSLASSTISYLSLFSLGFSSSYLRFYSRFKTKNDDESIRRLNGMFLVVFLLLAALVVFSGLVIASNIQRLNLDGYSASDLNLLKVLMLFMTFNMALSFPTSLFTSYISSQERFVFQKVINIGKTVVGPMLTLPALLLGYGSVGMVIVTTIVTIVIDVSNIYYCFFRLNMRIVVGKINVPLFKEIALFSLFLAINQVTNQLNWESGKLILGVMEGSKSVAIYTVAITINNMYMNFSQSISSVFAPQINLIVAKNRPDCDKVLTELFVKVGRIQFLLMMLILTGFIFFGEYFVLQWAGDGYYEAYYIALLMIMPTTIPLIQNIGLEIQRAKNKHQFRSIVYLIMAILNVFISIIACKIGGTIGVAMGIAITFIFAHGLIMNIYYQKRLGINVARFWKQIIRIIAGILPAIVAGGVITHYIAFSSMVEYLMFIMIYVVIYSICAWILAMNAYERDLIKKPIRMICGRLRYL